MKQRRTVNKIVKRSDDERQTLVEAGDLNAKRFDTRIALGRREGFTKALSNCERIVNLPLILFLLWTVPVIR